MKRQLLAAAAFFLLVAPNSKAIQLIPNHSFEDGLTGWTSTGFVEVLGPPRTVMNVGTDGTRAAALGTFDAPNSTLALVNPLMLSAGQSYSLSFDMLASGLGTAGLLSTVEVTILDFALNSAFHSVNFSEVSGDFVHNGAQGFSSKAFSFMVPNGVEKVGLSFLDKSPNGGRSVDLIIDNVVLRKTVPEPALGGVFSLLIVFGLSFLKRKL